MAETHNLLFHLALLGCLLMASEAFKDHIVGGGKGWRLPQNKTFYNEWSQSKSFILGDKLVFLFRSGANNLLEVSKEDFDACTQNNVIQRYHNGPTILELTEIGEHYYYCGVGIHCEAGQKLSINVTTAADAAAAAVVEPSS
ncbi:umecyanin-like isoform X2 [Typha latifolia]